MIGAAFPVRTKTFFLSSAKRENNAHTSPAGMAYFDIFSPLPGDTDVTKPDRAAEFQGNENCANIGADGDWFFVSFSY
jgi:hypothetical protein